MKLSRTSWLILITGIFVVSVGSLGFTHSQQLKEQDQQSDVLTIAEKRLSQLQTKDLSIQQEEMEEQLSQVRSELKSAKEAMRLSIESIEETDALFQIAETCSVNITDIGSSGIGDDKVLDISLSNISLTVRAEGDLPNLIDFVIKVNTDFTTGYIKSADINIPATTDEELVLPLVYIQIIVYSYQGD
ncbi:hypothetical protein ACFLXD_02830 [Chloroflexota bacterium]